MTTGLSPGFHSEEHGDLTASTAIPFTWLFPAPDIGIIQLDQPLKRLTCIPILHGLADLVTPAPGRWIRNAQIILELTGRGARGSDGHQKDRPKPVPQRPPGFVKDGVGSQGGLMHTTLALVFSARNDEIGLIMVTTGTAEAIRPFVPDEVSETIPLRAKPPFEMPGGH
jgi:hypothetical protein